MIAILLPDGSAVGPYYAQDFAQADLDQLPALAGGRLVVLRSPQAAPLQQRTPSFTTLLQDQLQAPKFQRWRIQVPAYVYLDVWARDVAEVMEQAREVIRGTNHWDFLAEIADPTPSEVPEGVHNARWEGAVFFPSAGEVADDDILIIDGPEPL